MVASPIDILPTVYKNFLFSTSSPKIVISCLFDDSHSDRYEVTSHFDLHFSGDYQYWESFHMLFRSFAHFWIFFFYAWLYELFLYFGSIAPFANIFSHSVCCSFCSWLSLLCKNVNFHLLIFNLYFYCSWKQIQKYIAVIYVSVLPMFSSRGFIVSSLILRSLIHSEFTFVYGIRKCSNFILLNISVQFPQHHLLKILSFLHCMFLPPLW